MKGRLIFAGVLLSFVVGCSFLKGTINWDINSDSVPERSQEVSSDTAHSN